MSFDLPNRGLVFWPVGNGDSTTIVIDSDTFVQVDLNHLERSDDDDDPTWTIVDELVDRLPKRDGRPYLSAFALTHPDQDHCRGFEELLSQVDIGELWFTPRVFSEFSKDLCDDATAFKKEAKRRVKATVAAKGDPGAGDRVRVFGYSDRLADDEDFNGFPEDRLTVPGGELTVVDEVELSGEFRAFVHAPFKDDDSGERNDTSLGLQITLYEGAAKLRALLLGDLKYPIVKRIFDVSGEDDVAWNVLLAPHHCSKSVMYWQEEGDDDERLKQDILDKMDAASQTPNRVISSSNPVPSSNQSGDNPPHAKAKNRYETLTDTFTCTMENPNTDDPEPVVAALEAGEITFTAAAATAKAVSASVKDARGSNAPPPSATTYGRDTR